MERETINSVVHSCSNFLEAFDYLKSSDFNNSINNSNNHLQIKIIIDEFSEEFPSKYLKKLGKKFKKNSVLLIFVESNENKFETYWKSKRIKQFLMLKPYKQTFSKDDKDLCEYVVEFLGTSLKNGYLGIHENFGNIMNRSKIQLHFLADSRNKNLIFLACESGNARVVDILLKYGISPDSSDTLVSIQDIAWQGRHSDVILKLLHANLPFPKSVDPNVCSEDLRKFIEISNEFHEMIKCKNQQRMDEILKEFPKLRYFYNLSNESALKTALDLWNMKMYEFLVARNLTFAPHEDTDKIWRGLNLTDREDLNVIHVKYLKDLPEKHINILMANTSLGHDETDEEGKLKLVLHAFRKLNEEPKIKIILKIVAAFKKFHIVFDFNRKSTYRIDPTSSPYTTGIFYPTGRILIGAEQLLDPATEHEAFGTLAHELCHLAMSIVYENKTNPYPQTDRKAVEDFEKISQICEDKKDAENIIKLVYTYPKSQQHSELIVRPPHMMAHYMKQPEILREKREIFNEIFDHFENVVIPAMENILPEIEGRLAYKPTYVYSKLSQVNQKKVQNAFVKYKNVKLKFCDLFSCTAVPYDKLTPDHISQFLDNKVLNVGDPHIHYLDKLVILDWKNLTEKLKQKFVTSNVNFQNLNVRFKNLQNSCPESFDALTSEQIIKILSGDKIFIGKNFEIESEFYVERKFMPEDGRAISFEYEYGHEYVHDRNIEIEHKRTRQTFLNKNFEEFTEEFLSQDLECRTKIIDKIKKNYLYKIRFYDLSVDYFDFMHKSLEDVIQQTENEKIFILSSEAGAGKTISFQQLTIQIKIQFPTRWVSYIDLKDHTKFYILSPKDSEDFFENSENIQKLLENILKLGSESENEFEKKIFSESFNSGNLVLVWNGFDEISPAYNEFILKLIKFIHENTKNIQYVCTRPLYSRQLFDTFKIRVWQLVPFNEDEKKNFLNEFFMSKNVQTDLIEEFITKVLEITKKFDFEQKVFRDFNSPLMLKLVAEIHEDEKLFESSNLYGIFETFVKKKIRIWIEKSEFARKTNENLILKSSKVSITEIFQKYAFLKEFKMLAGSTLGLKIKKLQLLQKKIPKDLPFEEISRMGILYIDGENKCEFSHRTFGEFFIAQYFIENIYLADDDVRSDEAELRLEIFFKVTKDYGYVKIIVDFMHYYLKIGNEDDNENLNETFTELLRTKFKRFLMNFLNTNHPKIFEFLFEFFKRDHDLLVELLQVYKNETFYTEIFNANNFSLATNPKDIKILANNYLKNEEFEAFLTGKHQVGKILCGIHFYGSFGIFKPNDSFDAEAVATDETSFWKFIEKIKNDLTEEEQKQLFLALMSPKIYLFYNEKMFNFSDNFEVSGGCGTSKISHSTPGSSKVPTSDASDNSRYTNLWDTFENLPSAEELQESIGNALMDYLEIYGGKKPGGDFFLTFLLQKCANFLSDSEIFEMFLSKNILHEVSRGNFEVMWKFLCNHTSKDERKEILLHDNEDDDRNFFFYYYPAGEIKRKYSNYTYYYYYFDFTPFKVFHRFITVPDAATFDIIKEIYEQHFKKTEIQKIIIKSNDFLYYLIGRVLEEPCRKFIAYLEEIFDGNEKSLKEFLERKIKPTNLSVFQYFDDFRATNEQIYFKNLQLFSELYEKITTKNKLK